MQWKQFIQKHKCECLLNRNVFKPLSSRSCRVAWSVLSLTYPWSQFAAGGGQDFWCKSTSLAFMIQAQASQESHKIPDFLFGPIPENGTKLHYAGNSKRGRALLNHIKCGENFSSCIPSKDRCWKSRVFHTACSPIVSYLALKVARCLLRVAMSLNSNLRRTLSY